MSFQHLAHLVFENELLREKILGYVIRDNDSDQVSYADVRSCRLVNKAWMHSISRIFLKRREPVFHFFLDEENSLSKSAAVGKNGKLLDNFVSSVSGTSRLCKQIPTFKLIICEEFFRQENYESLLKCFSRCGSGLVDLDIYFPDNGGSLTFTFPHCAFPKLKNLKILFMDDVHMELDEGEALVGNANGAYFLQLLLSGCKDLQNFGVTSYSENAPLPYGIDRLSLPATLASLKWTSPVLENKHYELLVRKELPKLEKLSLTIGVTSLAHGLIFKILDNVKTTLTHLSIAYFYKEEPEQPTYFRLPVMENLKVFKTGLKNLKLEDGVLMLQNCVPNLHEVTLDHQTTAMFRKWTESSKYASVRKLRVRLVSENHPRFHDEYNVGFPLEMMRLVEVAFPNIQTLNIIVCGTDLCGLKYAFQNLKTLQSLKVIVERSENIVNSDYWDALFIGTPVEFGTALRTTRNFWKDVKFGPNDDHPSIKNLTELRELGLVGYPYPPSEPNELSNSLISDVAFQFAFLNMPKLKKIRLYGRFMVSSEMMEQWRNQSTEHCINYCT